MEKGEKPFTFPLFFLFSLPPPKKSKSLILTLRVRSVQKAGKERAGAHFSKALKTFWSQKAIYKDIILSYFYKAVILTFL